MKHVVILKKEVGTPVQLATVENDLRSMQKLVNGTLAVIPLGNKIDLWYNDEFLFQEELQPNIILGNSPLCGQVFFASHDEEGNTTSLNKSQIEHIKKRIKTVGIKDVGILTIPVYLDVTCEELTYLEIQLADFFMEGDLNG